MLASIPGTTVNIPSPGQYRSGLPGLEYILFTNREDHRNYIGMQIAAHARQVIFWTEQEDEVYQNYQTIAPGTAIDFDAEYPIDKIEYRKLDLTIFDLQARVSLEFIKLLVAPARVPHPLQGLHRIVIAHPEDNDTHRGTIPACCKAFKKPR